MQICPELNLGAEERALLKVSDDEIEQLLATAKGGNEAEKDRLYRWAYLTASNYYCLKVKSESALATADAEELASDFFLEFERTFATNYPGTENYQAPFIAAAWRYAAAAVVLLFALYGALWFTGRATLPETYPLAALDGYEEKLTGQIRSKTAAEDEFSKGIAALLSAQESTLGLFPRYNQESVSKAIAHLTQGYDSATDPFQRAEIAFFLGKAYLMQNDTGRARQWLETALAQNVADYREEAAKLIGKLEKKK